MFFAASLSLAQSGGLILKEQHGGFKTAVAMSLFLVFTVVLLLLVLGKVGAFIFINTAYSVPLDYFFQYVTLLGDGLIYIPIVLYSFFYNRKFLIPLIASIIICTLITHFFKRVVFPGELRPFSLELQKIIIHKVEGVPLHRQHSFPSGHTSTAFTMALLLASVLRHRVWAYLLPLIAFGVGYSRIYLAQHFPTDVCAGMLIGIVSAYLSLAIYEAWLKKQRKKELPRNRIKESRHSEQ